MSSASVQPVRRVLLDKTTNTTLSPSKHQNIGAVADGKENTGTTSNHGMNKHSTVVAGCKRSIDHVDDNMSIRASPSNSASKRRAKEIDVNAGKRVLTWGSIMEQLGYSKANNGTSDKAAAVSHSIVVSQTDDKANSDQPEDVRSLYYAPPAAQEPRLRPSIIPTEPAAYEAFVGEKAALLRTRIRVAMKMLEAKMKMERRVSEIEAQDASRKSSRAVPRDVPQLLPPIDITPRKKSFGATVPARRQSLVIPATGSPSTKGHSPGEEEGDDLSPLSDGPPSPQLPQIRNKGGPFIIQRTAPVDFEEPNGVTKRGEALDGLLKLMKTTTEFDDLDILPE